MTLEDVLAGDSCNYEIIDKFVAAKGLSNVTVKDLDKIVEKFGNVVRINDFYTLYNIVSSNETNKKMGNWAALTGILTIVVTIATLINLYLFVSTL